MIINRTRIARAAVSAVFALSLAIGTQAFMPSALADCGTPIGSGCKDSVSATGGSLNRSIEDTTAKGGDLTLDLPQLRVLFELLGVLV